MTYQQHVVTAARQWVGTPWHHRASCLGAGADCLGLIRGVWRQVVGPEPVPIPAYSDDCSRLRDRWDIKDRMAAHFTPCAAELAQPGDVLLLCMSQRSAAKHLAILADKKENLTLIHSYEKHGVVEQHFSKSWRRRAVEGFRFPERLS